MFRVLFQNRDHCCLWKALHLPSKGSHQFLRWFRQSTVLPVEVNVLREGMQLCSASTVQVGSRILELLNVKCEATDQCGVMVLFQAYVTAYPKIVHVLCMDMAEKS